MFKEILSKNEKESLAVLGKSGILNGAYMAGGTALALQIGHRFSYDFDFFTAEEFDENFADAEESGTPKMIEPILWKDVKSFFQKEARNFGRNML